MKHNPETGHLVVNLKELHDILTNISNLGLTTVVNKVSSIGIIDDTLTEDQMAEWAIRMSEVMTYLNDIDCVFHDNFGCYDGVDIS